MNPCGVFVSLKDVRKAVRTAPVATKATIKKVLESVNANFCGQVTVDVMFLAQHLWNLSFELQNDSQGFEAIMEQIKDSRLVPTVQVGV